MKEHTQEEHRSSKRKRKLVCDSDEESNSGLGGGGDESGDSTDDFLFSINRRQRALRSRLPGRGGMYPKITSIGIIYKKFKLFSKFSGTLVLGHGTRYSV